MEVLEPSDPSLYAADAHAWIARQVAVLRSGQLDALDSANLIDYLTAAVARDRQELRSRFIALLQHMLQIKLQPARHSRRWNVAVLDAQQHLRQALGALPSLAGERAALYAEVYPEAVRLAIAETGMTAAAFPHAPPWSVDDALAFVPPAPPLSAWAMGRRRDD